jgi:shikimate dehydrogenase
LKESEKIAIGEKKVLILGNGGTSKTAQVICRRHRSMVTVIDTELDDNYSNIYKRHSDAEIIINTTPVGMYPNNGGWLIDLSNFPKLEGVIDVVYNPLATDLILQARERGIKNASGLKMLVAQAKLARDTFLNQSADNDIIEEIYNELRNKVLNIVLIGMMSCGKSTVGVELAKVMGKNFVDTDKEIERKTGEAVEKTIERHGLPHFRKLEQEVLPLVGKENGQVISCGGGSVLNPNAYEQLKQNGIIIWLRRDLDKYNPEGRIFKNIEDVKKVYTEREPIYKKFADITVDNSGTVQDTVKKILEGLNEYTGS